MHASAGQKKRSCLQQQVEEVVQRLLWPARGRRHAFQQLMRIVQLLWLLLAPGRCYDLTSHAALT
jgi:hypothetical protein